MFKNLGFQEYLSIGYLYLLILGVVSESIFYRMLGINILHFASLSDILTAPLTLLVSHWMIPASIVGMILVLFLLTKLSEKFNAKHNKEQSVNLLVLCSAFIFFGFFIGIELGRGTKQKSLIAEGKNQPNYLITFDDGQAQKVKVIGQNSTYLFYVPENGKKLIITLIDGNVKKMEVL
ncbi:hypothetical protein [Flectobacillus roseus]|jgi:hypothetical protein|uniref:DUF1449 family protein n=1 Tax=Flectobacillus roseus TaxID=502259 RepID=A0ABT6Y827_9BACT|nr:hypothetical protein [Flectobacillus roseus]MDI9859724.1 hypothetical protein [Flectobacillus roseus]MDI9872016.1 hypothetical protein [Flectobacillus roseus]